jgi:hypothetical protein
MPRLTGTIILEQDEVLLAEAGDETLRRIGDGRRHVDQFGRRLEPEAPAFGRLRRLRGLIAIARQRFTRLRFTGLRVARLRVAPLQVTLLGEECHGRERRDEHHRREHDQQHERTGARIRYRAHGRRACTRTRARQRCAG